MKTEIPQITEKIASLQAIKLYAYSCMRAKSLVDLHGSLSAFGNRLLSRTLAGRVPDLDTLKQIFGTQIQIQIHNRLASSAEIRWWSQDSSNLSIQDVQFTRLVRIYSYSSNPFAH